MYNPYIIYDEIYIPDFISQQYIKTNMQICFIKKVSISYSHNSLVKSPSEISVPYTAITYITGQRPVIALAKKSISSWKLRKKALIGCKVTLRRQSAFLYLLKLYTYGFFIPLVQNKNYFLKKTSFGCKNPLKKDYFFELQKCGLRWRNFEGFSITLSL